MTAAAPLPRDFFARCGDSIAYWAEKTPDRLALRDPLAALSYAGLVRAVDAAAADLAAFGAKGGHRVLILCENSIAAAIAILASQRLGAWPVPLNARLSAAEVDDIVAHCSPQVVVTCDAVSAEARAHGKRLGTKPTEVFSAWGAALAKGPAPGQPEPLSDDPRQQVAALIYSSGTTGAPKGVMLTHDNIMFSASRGAEMRGLVPGDRVYGVLPVSHVFGMSGALNGTLYQGAELDLVARFDAGALLRALAEDGITSFSGVPQMFARLVALAEAADALSAPRLRFLGAGGAPLDPALKARVEAVFGVWLHNGYGLTETSPIVSMTTLTDYSDDPSVGPPVADVEVTIAQPEGFDGASDEVGEIWVRGRQVMKGYYEDPQQTAEVITPAGWFKTGDLGYLDARGWLYVSGRLKELIIRSGFNVFPPEVEAVLTKHPGVALAAVIGRKAADGNEEVIAFLQPEPGHEIDVDAVRAFAAERLAPYKRPAEIRVMAELPAAPTGKLLKRKLYDYF